MEVSITEVLQAVGYLLISAGVAALIMRIGGYFEK